LYSTESIILLLKSLSVNFSLEFLSDIFKFFSSSTRWSPSFIIVEEFNLKLFELLLICQLPRFTSRLSALNSSIHSLPLSVPLGFAMISENSILVERFPFCVSAVILILAVSDKPDAVVILSDIS